MTNHIPHPSDTTRADAVLTTVETASDLADAIHRHRMAVAACARNWPSWPTPCATARPWPRSAPTRRLPTAVPPLLSLSLPPMVITSACAGGSGNCAARGVLERHR